MRINKPKLDKNTARYIAISYINTGLNILVNLFLINILSSSNFGKISLGKTVFQSFDYSHLGIRNGFDRFFPLNSEKEKINEYFTAGIIGTFISSIFFLLFWIIYKSDSIVFYLLFAISGVISSVIMLYRVYYRSQKDKNKFVKLSSFFILLPPIAEFLGLLIAGINGYISAFVLSYIVIFFIVQKKFSIRFSFNKSRFFFNLKKILDKGWLLYLSGLVTFFSTSIDRFFIENFWGLENVGRFSVIMFIFSVFSMFSINYTEMIMSKIISLRSFKFVCKQIIIIIILIMILVVVVYFVLPYMIEIFMKQYMADIQYMRIIIFAAIPYSVLSILNYFLHAIDRRKIMLCINVFCSLLYFIGLYFILTNSNSLEYIMYLKFLFYFIVACFTGIAAIIFSKQIKMMQ